MYFCTLHHAAEHWKARSRAGEDVRAAVINTAGPAALSLVAAGELRRYGVRVNAIMPIARVHTVAPLVAWLASADCDVSGRVYAVDDRWTSERMGKFANLASLELS
jgi:hypothetical protein